jgi:ribosomal protein S18 acetylase RimI-like enzyme
MTKWRAMTASDLDAVEGIADRVHSAYPEDAAVFAERLHLYPDGCYVLGDGDEVVGYLLSHPWHERNPPALNARLGAIPSRPTTYFIHDIAILPSHRWKRKAQEVVATCAAQAMAQGLATLSLVAVNASTPFWQKRGFQRVIDPYLDARLKTYDADACLMIRALGP